jgi:hypothetical protein
MHILVIHTCQHTQINIHNIYIYIYTGKWTHNRNDATIRFALVMEWNEYTGKLISSTHYEVESQTAQVCVCVCLCVIVCVCV